MRKLTAIDLFCGAGGLTQGLKQAGFNVLGAVEVNSTFAESYMLNHPTTCLYTDDITNLKVSDMREKLLLEVGELDLLAGCPPCQGYSTIGTRNRGEKNDPRNALVYQIVRFAKALNPKTIMMENVPVLASDGRMTSVLELLKDIGYHTDVKVLNMIHYDVPQTRKRMIMLASRLDNIEVENKTVDANEYKTVRKAIGVLESTEESNDPLHNYVVRRSTHITEMISLVPKDGGSRTDLPDEYQLECHKKTTGFKDVYGRMSWDYPSPTITGGCISPSKGRFLHPEKNRAITLREASLLQTFPRNYKFSLSSGREGVATMIGNALPPAFIEHHARHLVEHIQRFENTTVME